MIYERGRICFEPAKLGTDVFSQLYSTNNANKGLHIGHVLNSFIKTYIPCLVNN
jgi:hypothetical protein